MASSSTSTSSNLHLRPDQICAICNCEIIRKKDTTHKKDLKRMKEYASKWKQLKLPANNHFREFVHAHTRLLTLKEATFHKNCIMNIKKYKNYSQFVVHDSVPHTAVDTGTSTNDISSLTTSDRLSKASLTTPDRLSKASLSTPDTRSNTSSPTQKERCFVCDNHSSTEKVFSISRLSVTEENKSNMSYHLKQGNSPYFTAAKRLNRMISSTNNDTSDVHYHLSCLLSFNRISKEKEATKHYINKILGHIVKDIFNAYVRARIVNERNAYLLNVLLKDSQLICEEHGIEPVFSEITSLKKHIEENVKEVSFYETSKSLIVHPADIDPIMYSESSLKAYRLRRTDLMGSFAKMIHRIVDEYKHSNDPIDWPISADNLTDVVDKDKPITELYNIILKTIDRTWMSSTVPLNKYGFAKIESRDIRNKVWSLANDWTALLTGRKNVKQINLSMLVHCMNDCEEVVEVLEKSGHGISYNDILLQNEVWAASIDTVSMDNRLSVISMDTVLSDTVTVSSIDNIDNNNGSRRQSNFTDKSQQTNCSPFELKLNDKEFPYVTKNNINNNEAANNSGKLVLSQLIPDFQEDAVKFYVDECFASDILWSLVGGLNTTETLLGSWRGFNQLVCGEEVCQSLLTYLPMIEYPPQYPICKEYLEFILEVTGLIELQDMFMYTDEGVYARIFLLICTHKDYFNKVLSLIGGLDQLRVLHNVLYKRQSVIGCLEWYSNADVIDSCSPTQAKQATPDTQTSEDQHHFQCLRSHIQNFNELSHQRIHGLTNQYKNVDETLLNDLKKLRNAPSHTLFQSIMRSGSFKQLLKDFLSVEVEGKMIMQYLRYVSFMSSILSTVREDSFHRYLEAERRFLKLVVLFDHINYNHYDIYNTINVTNHDLKHGDLDSESVNKETKGIMLDAFKSEYDTNMHTNKPVKNSRIHKKFRRIVKSRFQLLTSSTPYKELTPRNKNNHKVSVDTSKTIPPECSVVPECNTVPLGVDSVLVYKLTSRNHRDSIDSSPIQRLDSLKTDYGGSLKRKPKKINSFRGRSTGKELDDTIEVNEELLQDHRGNIALSKNHRDNKDSTKNHQDHKDFSKNHRNNENSSNQKVQKYNLTNPEFRSRSRARNISTVKEVNDNISINDLLTAEQLKNEQHKELVHDRLVTEEFSMSDCNSKPKPKADEGVLAKKRMRKGDVLVEDRAFSTTLARCQSKEEAFTFPITSYPLSIATPNGGCYQGDKTTFRDWLIGKQHHDKENVCEAAWIFDAGYIFTLIKPQETYRDFFRAIVTWMVTVCRDARPSSIVIAVDDYRVYSTKEMERRSRGNGNEGKRVIVSGVDQQMPKGGKWIDFMTNSDNMNDIMSLFGSYITNDNESKRIFNCIPVTFCGKNITLNGINYTCNHEDVSTKIPLMAFMMEGDVIVVTEDTDVLILLVATFADTSSHRHWQMHYKENTYANIGKICNSLGDKNSSLLLAFHALTGCNTTSFFCRRGKTIPFKTAMKKGKLNLLDYLGMNLKVTDEEIGNCKEFIRSVVYGGKDDESYLDTRIRLYDEQEKKTTSVIPPDHDSCIRHIYRAHFVAYMWRIGIKHFEIPSIDPLQYGWNICEGVLTPTWFMCSQFPPSLSSRNKRRGGSDGYEADIEPQDEGGNGNCKRRKSKRKIKNMVVSRGCMLNGISVRNCRNKRDNVDNKMLNDDKNDDKEEGVEFRSFTRSSSNDFSSNNFVSC